MVIRRRSVTSFFFCLLARFGTYFRGDRFFPRLQDRILLRSQQRFGSPQFHGCVTGKYFWRSLIVLKRDDFTFLRIGKDLQSSCYEVCCSAGICFEIEHVIMNGGDKEVVAIDIDAPEHFALTENPHPRQEV